MLYIKLDKKPKTLKELMIQFFSHKGVFGDRRGVATFNDPECQEQHTPVGKYRSFDDVLEVAKTYFPTTTKKKLMKVLIDLRFSEVSTSGEPLDLRLWIANCDGIERPTMVYNNGGGTYRVINDDKMKKSKYKWSKLLALVGKDYTNFLKD